MPSYRDSRFVRLVLFLFFALALAYGAYEAQGLFYGPAITLSGETMTSHEAFITIHGTVERISELRLNGTTISVTESGEFDAPYLLAPGSNRLIFEARDARNRTTSEVIDIVYLAPPETGTVLASPPTPASTTTASSSKGF